MFSDFRISAKKVWELVNEAREYYCELSNQKIEHFAKQTIETKLKSFFLFLKSFILQYL